MSIRITPRRLSCIDTVLTALFILSFLSLFIIKLLLSVWAALLFLLTAAFFFLLLSAMRAFWGKSRPKGAKKISYSFPSRHAGCAFFIATVFFSHSSLVIPFLYAAAILLATIRVLRGLHFPRDVVSGAFLGVLFGIISLLIM